MNMQALLKQAQKMQKELGKAEAELKEKTYEASVGGGVVKATVKGSMEIENIEIADELFTSEGKEDLQALIVSAINEALHKATEEKEAIMNKMTGGIKMPGGF